jgi:hypothetical protein
MGGRRIVPAAVLLEGALLELIEEVHLSKVINRYELSVRDAASRGAPIERDEAFFAFPYMFPNRPIFHFID